MSLGASAIAGDRKPEVYGTRYGGRFCRGRRLQLRRKIVANKNQNHCAATFLAVFSRRSIHNKYQIGEASWPLSYLIICPIKIPARNVASRLPRLSGSRTDRAGRRISGSAPTAATGSKRSHSSARRTSTLTRSRPDDNRPALRTIVVRVFAHLRRNGGGTEALISSDDFFHLIGTCARRAWVNPEVASVACRYLKSLRRFVAAGNPTIGVFSGTTAGFVCSRH